MRAASSPAVAAGKCGGSSTASKLSESSGGRLVHEWPTIAMRWRRSQILSRISSCRSLATLAEQERQVHARSVWPLANPLLNVRPTKRRAVLGEHRVLRDHDGDDVGLHADIAGLGLLLSRFLLRVSRFRPRALQFAHPSILEGPVCEFLLHSRENQSPTPRLCPRFQTSRIVATFRPGLAARIANHSGFDRVRGSSTSGLVAKNHSSGQGDCFGPNISN